MTNPVIPNNHKIKSNLDYTNKTPVWLIIFIIIFVAYAVNAGPVSGNGIDDKDKPELMETTAANINNIQKLYKTNHVPRGSHAKSHGCVQAWFDTNSYIDFKLRYGIFTRPGQRYKSWIRFSNGHIDIAASQDQKRDVRGMAIKILEPPREPLLIAADGIPVQDFLMVNSPVTFVRTIEDYNDFIVKQQILWRFFLNGWNPLKWRIEEWFLARKVLTPPPSSLLNPQYYSVTAYTLGPHNIKFSARPCAGQNFSSGPDESNPDLLRHNLQQALEIGEACFDFMVQLQDPEKDMPVEDPAVEWKESDSPFIPMARITILSQVFDTEEQMNFCENLTFNPWHTHPDMEPIGQINRIRQNVYQASSKYRLEQIKAEVSSENTK